MKITARKKLPTAKWRTLGEAKDDSAVKATRARVFNGTGRFPKTVYCLKVDTKAEEFLLQLSAQEATSLLNKLERSMLSGLTPGGFCREYGTGT